MKEKAIIRIIALCLYLNLKQQFQFVYMNSPPTVFCLHLNLKQWFERPYRQVVFIQPDCNIRKNYLIVQEFSKTFALQTCK